MFSFLRLPGLSSNHSQAPAACSQCQFQTLYHQPDFNRSVGLWIVGIASFICFVLLYQKADWWLSWSPMFAVLVIDRLFYLTSPLAVICYKCGHIHRGLDKTDAQKFEYFDLETYDRIHYQDNLQKS